MLHLILLFCSRPRALAFRVYYIKLLPTWNKDYLSVTYECVYLAMVKSKSQMTAGSLRSHIVRAQSVWCVQLSQCRTSVRQGLQKMRQAKKGNFSRDMFPNHDHLSLSYTCISLGIFFNQTLFRKKERLVLVLCPFMGLGLNYCNLRVVFLCCNTG